MWKNQGLFSWGLGSHELEPRNVKEEVKSLVFILAFIYHMSCSWWNKPQHEIKNLNEYGYTLEGGERLWGVKSYCARMIWRIFVIMRWRYWNESKVKEVRCEITQVPKRTDNLKTKFSRVNFSKQKFSALGPCRCCNFDSTTFCAQTFASTVLFHFHSQGPETFLATVVTETFVLLVDKYGMESSIQRLACKIEKQAVRQSHSFVDLAHKIQWSLEKSMLET